MEQRLGQIPYTLTYKIGKPNKRGECLVYIRYFSKDNDILVPTSVRVAKSQFDGQSNPKKPIKSHPLKDSLNNALNNHRLDIELIISNHKGRITGDVLKGDGRNGGASPLLVEYLQSYADFHKGKLSPLRLKQYNTAITYVSKFDKKAKITDINSKWLLGFENSLINAELSHNTVVSKINMVIAVLNFAVKEKIISKDIFSTYKPPRFIDNLPEYLTEDELNSFSNILRTIQNKTARTAGYYFLLSCYTGYRLSDLKRFDYSTMVKDNLLTLRAKKNGKIVSISIYPKLADVLVFCKDNQFSIAEQTMRKEVKAIAKLAGIDGRNIKIHSGRHTFAMLMLKKGLTIDEVADKLGDSKDIARIYARIDDSHVNDKILKIMS